MQLRRGASRCHFGRVEVSSGMFRQGGAGIEAPALSTGGQRGRIGQGGKLAWPFLRGSGSLCVTELHSRASFTKVCRLLPCRLLLILTEIKEVRWKFLELVAAFGSD